MLSVAIDGSALSDGSQNRGIGTYLTRLVAALPEHGVDPLVLCDPAAKLPSGTRRADIRWHAPRRLRDAEHDLRFVRLLRQHADGVAALHSPAQSPPRRPGLPWVQTVHDLTPLVFPHPLLEGDRRRWLRRLPRLRAADAVICCSRSSADQVRRFAEVAADRLHVVPLGVDAKFQVAGDVVDRAPYVLWVSAWGPHKGLAEAAAVVAELAAMGHEHRLVVAGPQDSWMLARAKEQVAASPRPDLVDIVGYVDDLAALYRGAAALVMSSRAEGFGLPALEAMACGTPVVAFDNTSLPEVVGDAGILVTDGDVPAMSNAVDRVLRDTDLARQLSDRGVEHAGRFSWSATASAHAAVYRTIAGLGLRQP